MALCGCFSGFSAAPAEALTLNVGGVLFTTSRATLLKCPPDSVIHQLVKGKPGRDGSYFLDFDGSHFKYVLNYLREGDDYFPPDDPDVRKEIMVAAKRFRIPALVTMLQQEVVCASQAPDGGYAGAPVPSNETRRLQRLDDLDVMHTNQEERQFNNITKVVAAILDVPIALVSLVGAEYQWFKAKTGLDADQTPRNTSFCAFMLSPENPENSAMLVVEDAHRDDRVANNPLVTGPPHIRFYAGAPLQTSDGVKLGALCSIDTRPRSITQMQAQVLVNLAQVTMQEIERKELLDEVGLEEDVMFSETAPCTFASGILRRERMKEALNEPLLLVWAAHSNFEWPVLFANSAWEEKARLLIDPSSRFPVLPQVVGNGAGIQLTKNKPLSLWDWLRLGMNEAKDLQTYVGSASDQEVGYARHFAIEAMVPARAWGGDARSTNFYKVSCRFSPAELPLDAAAAVTRPYRAHESGNTAGGKYQPAGLPPGRLYFVAISGGAPDVGGKTVETIAAAVPRKFSMESTDTSHAQSDPGGRVGVRDKKIKINSWPSDTGLAETDTSGKTLSALQSIKPPKAPFEDVKLIRLKGNGVKGQVYFGLWSGSPVAVKVLQTKKQDNAKLQSFEGCLSANLLHPNVVQTYKQSTRASDYYQNGVGVVSITAKTVQAMQVETIQETWIVQEWCDGGSLDEHCQKIFKTGLDCQELLEVCLDIASSGSYLHSRNICHGDLQARNVLLKSDVNRRGYICKVCNFGFAQITGAVGLIAQTSKRTIAQLPPECLTGANGTYEMNNYVDIYAFGMLIYRVCTGKWPEEGVTVKQMSADAGGGCRLQLPEDTSQIIVMLYNASVAQDPLKRPTFEKLSTELSSFLSVGQRDGSSKTDKYRGPKSAPNLGYNK